MATARWIAVRLDAISATALTSGALLAMAIRGTVRPEILGLALTHIIQLTGAQLRARAVPAGAAAAAAATTSAAAAAPSAPAATINDRCLCALRGSASLSNLLVSPRLQT